MCRRLRVEEGEDVGLLISRTFAGAANTQVKRRQHAACVRCLVIILRRGGLKITRPCLDRRSKEVKKECKNRRQQHRKDEGRDHEPDVSVGGRSAHRHILLGAGIGRLNKLVEASRP
jgi:hypothetical protein